MAVLLALLIVLAPAGKGYGKLSPREAAQALARDSGIVVLDVRRPDEFASATGHLEKALLIPVEDLGGRIGELDPYRGRTLLVYCRTGHRSSIACGLLSKKGFRVYNLEGGILKWNEGKFPAIMEPER